MRSAIDIKATTYICGVANFFVKIFFTIIFVVGTTHLLKSQNLIYNSGFEESSSNYVTYVGYHPIINKYYRPKFKLLSNIYIECETALKIRYIFYYSL